MGGNSPRVGRKLSPALPWPVLPWIIATAVTLLSLLAVVQIDAMEQRTREEAARASIRAQLDTIRAKLEASLTGPLLRTRGLVANIIAHGDITQQQFDTLARVLLEGHGSVINMVVSRGMVIAMSYPLAGNESVIGVAYPSIPAQYAQVLKAIETRAPVLQGPVPLIQGGSGLIFRNPVFLDGADGTPGPFFGMVNIILDIPKVFAEAGLDDPALPFDVAIRGRDGLGAAGALIAGDETIFARAPVQTDAHFPHGTWRLAAVPKGGWESVRNGLTPLRAMGSALFLLMAFTAFGTARHVIRRAEAEDALRRRTQELQQSNADLERFAYAASHDLQTPLRNVVSYAQILERRYHGQLDADADEYLGFLAASARRMSLLVHDLLNYVQVSGSGGPLRPVDANAALARALANVQEAAADCGADIQVEALPTVLGSEPQLVSLFQNLIGNALRFRCPAQPPVVRISASRLEDGMWRLSVADNGIGIAPEFFERIFMVFQRLHGPGGRQTDGGGGSGSGVGLAVCRRIVQRFGGTIWVESEPGKGATFHFTLRGAQEE